MDGDFLKLVREECVVLDGAFGTLLQERGLTPDRLPEEWNLLHPDVVRDIHLEYLIAGAQIITTNTFGASPLKLGLRGRENLTDEANRAGVRLVREAIDRFRSTDDVPVVERDEYRFIAASVGPCGKLLSMELQPEDLEHSIITQANALVQEGIDLFIVETMMDLNEAELTVRTLKEQLKKPVLVSMVFNRIKDGSFRTLFGDRVGDAVERLGAAGADGVGTNCGLIEDYLDVIKEMRELTDIPLVLYPNAGIPKLKDGETHFDVTADEMIESLEASIQAGATILGGCCGTTPDYIGLLSRRLSHRKRAR
jgi:5-methyltetrahydrofolate--homocysteine methyltransferase